jgi:hypothetical protein
MSMSATSCPVHSASHGHRREGERFSSFRALMPWVTGYPFPPFAHKRGQGSLSPADRLFLTIFKDSEKVSLS